MEQKEKMRHILLTLHGTWIEKYFSFLFFLQHFTAFTASMHGKSFIC